MEQLSNLGKAKTLIHVLELKRLIFDIRDRRPDICIRFRMLGEMWAKSFCHIIQITEQTLLLQDEGDQRLIAINDLSSIMQFEIDYAFLGYQPHFHYNVTTFGSY
jgi:hypothetical protein